MYISYPIDLELQMNYLKAHECLSLEKERELGFLAMEGNPKAKEELIMSNIKYVYSVAKRFCGYGLDYEELVEEGLVGLCEAVEHFNPDKGARLITYATYWIRNAILDGINESGTRIRLSGEKFRKVIKLKKNIAEARNFISDVQSLVEYAANQSDCTVEEAQFLLSCHHDFVNLESPIKIGDDSTLLDQLADYKNQSVEDEVINADVKRNVEKEIRKLKPSEQDVLKYHYGLTGEDPKSFKTIAEKLGKSRARVHQIEQYAMKKLKKNFYAAGF